MHLHDRRECSVLRPAHEKIGMVGSEIRILVTANIMSPNRKPAHRGGIAGRDHALQSIGLAVIRLVVPGPAGWIRAGTIETTSGEENSISTENARNGFVVLDT